MDTLRSLHIFRLIVELGSFTRAAEHLNISLAMASKHIRHLEQQLQAKLLHRNSRKISLTEIGQQYYQQSTQALDILKEAAIQAEQGTITPQGCLKITVPIWCATEAMAHLLAAYQTRYPQIKLSLYLENQHSNLAEQGFDLALRATNTPEAHWIAKPLAQIPFYWVASPHYLQQHSTPKNVADLSQHLGITPNYTDIHSPMHHVADSNNTLMIRQMILANMGIGLLPSMLVAEDLAQGHLQQLLPEEPQIHHTLYAIYANRSYLSAKVRTFIDFLAEHANIFSPTPNKTS